MNYHSDYDVGESEPCGVCLLMWVLFALAIMFALGFWLGATKLFY